MKQYVAILFSLALSQNAYASLLNPMATPAAAKKSSVLAAERIDVTLLNPIAQQSSEECGASVKPLWIELRHIEGKGVGYSKGYTTLEGFFSLQRGRFVPLLNLRGHVFDDGKFAANAGVGLRYSSSYVYGINAYYDYRQTSQFHYNQISMGLEALGRWVDYRINGYLPVGKKTSPLFGTEFDSFQGNNLILSSQEEFAFKGANAEVGVHILKSDHTELYGAAGPYYFEGKGENAWGGEARFAATFYNWLKLEVNGSYDPVFRWIGQGQLSLNYAFGPRKKVSLGKYSSCTDALALNERRAQSIDRNEIIVVDRKHKKSVAIDPATGKPIIIWFVSNTSSSAGTRGSPFATLFAAQNASKPRDVIYIFPGDGTTKGMTQGFVMKDNQRILGSGIAQNFLTTLGQVTVPAQSATFPSITNTLATSTITLANSCEVSGLNLTTATNQSAIAGGVGAPSGITNTLIHNNIITGAGFVVFGAIELTNCQGNLIVENNTIVNSPFDAIGINNLLPTVNCNIQIANNTIQGLDTMFGGGKGINVTRSGPSGNSTVNIK